MKQRRRPSKGHRALAATLAYLRAGWPVFPAFRGGAGVEFDEALENVRDGLGDAQDVRDVLAACGKAEIAVRCGGETGIVAVEICGASGEQNLRRWTPEGSSSPGITVELLTDNGRALFFRAPRQVARGRLTCALGVELFGDGQVVVLPPRPERVGRYKWAAGRGPGQVRLAELPRFLDGVIGGDDCVAFNVRAMDYNGRIARLGTGDQEADGLSRRVARKAEREAVLANLAEYLIGTPVRVLTGAPGGYEPRAVVETGAGWFEVEELEGH